MTNRLNYVGDCTDIDTTSFVGADLHGAFYRPVSAVYDLAANRTTVQFKPIAPADVPAVVVAPAQRRADLAALFGGAP